MAKFCTNCGKKAEEGEEYCAFCGQNLTGKPKEEQTNTSVVNNTKNNDMAMVGLIISIAVSGIIGIIICAIALSQIKKTGEKGKELAIIGIVIGCLKIAFTILWFIFAIFMSITDYDNYYDEYDFSSRNAIVEVIEY